MASYVAINVLTVPSGQRGVLEERFAARAGLVEQAEGFERFELLRPIDGTDQYLVYTRWRSKEDFERWRAGRGARAHEAGDEQRRPAATGAQLWTFEVIQEAEV
ncbi:MAG TPA: antibiotic biosynthesis monooxygenase [Micromonosporaceae bacterium]